MNKLDFKRWLLEQFKKRFYENFVFDSGISDHELRWLTKNFSRKEVGDAFWLEAKEEQSDRRTGAGPQKVTKGEYVLATMLKDVGQLHSGAYVGVSQSREGMWTVVSVEDPSVRVFVNQGDLASSVKSVRPVVSSPNVEGLRASIPAKAPAPVAQNVPPQKTEEPRKDFWIYAKVKQDIEQLKVGEDVGVHEVGDGSWEIWSFDGQRMAATTKSDLPNVVQSVRKVPDDPRSIYKAPTLQALHDLVADLLEKPKADDADKKKHVLATEQLSEEQKRIDARFERMMSSATQDHMMINALAGSGKTTMLKHLAWKYGKPGQRWLYLVFNTKNKVEAQEKFPTTWVDVRTTNGFLGNLLRSDENVERIDQTDRLIELLNRKKRKPDDVDDDDEEDDNDSPMPRSKMGEIVDGPQFNEVLKRLNIPEDAHSDAVIDKMRLDEYSTSAAKGCAHSIRYIFKEESQRVADLAKAYGIDPRKEDSHVRASLEEIFKSYDIDITLSEVKERIRKYRSPRLSQEVLAALKRILGYDFMSKRFKDELTEAAIWLLKSSLPRGIEQTLTYKGVDYDLGTLRDFSDDIWFAAINAHDMHWPKYDVVLADEVQDFNPCQKLMLEKLHEAGAKIVAVGDPNQAIYRFRGADGDAFHGLGHKLKDLSGDKETEHTLTTNYRSRRCILDHVNAMGHVTGLKHSEKKFPGGGTEGCKVTKEEVEYEDLWGQLRKEHAASKRKDGAIPMQETAFIARTNEPLVQAALRLLADGVPFVIVGRDVANELMKHINKVLKDAKLKDDAAAIPHPKAKGRPNLGEKLEQYQEKENKRWGPLNSKKAYLQEMNATTEALYAALGSFSGMPRDMDEMDQGAYEAMMRAVASRPVPTVRDFKKWLKARLGGFNVQDNEQDLKAYREKVKREHPVVLTTAHKSKGLEFSRVYILRDDQFPHPKAELEADKLQEENARYVAYTRAGDELHIVKLKGQPGYKEPGGE